jgi:hypothetical protein
MNGFKEIPQQPQRQDSLNEQLHDLVKVANRLGMYDAADSLQYSLHVSGINRMHREKR